MQKLYQTQISSSQNHSNFFDFDIKINTAKKKSLESEYKIKKVQQIFNEQIKMQNTISFINKKQFVKGRLSRVWLFVIRYPSFDLITHINRIYNYQHMKMKGQIIPFCNTLPQTLKFINSSKFTLFKMIMDQQNSQNYLDFINANKQVQQKIQQIYIFNNNQESSVGMIKAMQIQKKVKNKKVKILNDLKLLLNKVQIQHQNTNQFYQSRNITQNDYKNEEYLQKRKLLLKLPVFIPLLGQDKTQITQYRSNLFSAIKLSDPKERQAKLNLFKTFVQELYESNQQQLLNLFYYLNKIDHIRNQLDQSQIMLKHTSVLKQYIKPTFYHKTINNVLRFCRTIQQFKPITLPFNQNYNAIKYFYNKSLAKNNNKIQSFKLFRVAAIKQKDLQLLKVGKMIQLLGFVSASKNQKYVLDNFLKQNDDYLFTIQIKSRTINTKFIKYDHGFVDLVQQGIAQSEFQEQQQVLLNALNVFRVINVQKSINNKVGRIDLQYAPMFLIYQKSLNNYEQLTLDEKDMLHNYKYSVKLMDQIQDQGDVLFNAQQLDKCREFYQNKLKSQQTNIKKYYTKMAQVQLRCGNLEKARQNALKSLQQFQKQHNQIINQIQTLDQNKCKQIMLLQNKNSQIFKQEQDTVMSKKSLNLKLQLLDLSKEKFRSIDNLFMKCQGLLQIGQIYYKQGNIIESQSQLKKAEMLLIDYQIYLQEEKQKIQNKYSKKSFFSNLSFFNTRQARYQEQQKQQQLKILQKQIQQFQRENNKFFMLLLKIIQSMKKNSLFVGDNKSYKKLSLKAKQYFEQIQIKQSNDSFYDAKIKVLEATVLHDYNEQKDRFEKCEQILQQSIQKMQEISPFSESVGEMKSTLGEIKQKYFDQSIILPFIQDEQQQEQISNKRFPYQQKQQLYNQIKQTYSSAIDVLSYHYSEDNSKIFQIRINIGTLGYQYCKYDQSRNQANVVLQSDYAKKHSQGAKAALLLAKVYLSKGQILNAFQNIQKSIIILKKSIIKQQKNQQYIHLFESSPLNIQIQLFRAKIYNRQLQHDLALHSINKCIRIAQKNINNIDSVGYLANVYQEKGNTQFYRKKNQNFYKYYNKAIELRQKQMGQFNIYNAITLCILCQKLLFTEQRNKVEKYLNKSLKIFSHFRPDHPHFWIQHASIAMLCQSKNQSEQQLKQLRRCFQILEYRYSKDHITYLKMKAIKARSLCKNNLFQQAIMDFQTLKEQVQNDLMMSKTKFQIEDEKIGLHKQIQKNIDEIRKSFQEFTKFKISPNSTQLNSSFFKKNTKEEDS